MGKDYRIGLVAGSILVGVALTWVATRPSLGPWRPSGPDTDRTALGTNEPVPIVPMVSTARSGKSGGQKAENGRPKPTDGLISPSVLSPASSAVRSLSPGSPDLTAQGKSEPTQTPRYHIVLPGETLSTIAQQYYGSTNSWRKIVAANEKTIKDGSKIVVGMKLIIP
jgi:nucleoid-associated protein YgaU